MKCDDVSKRIPDYLTGETDGAAKAEIEGHLQACDSCRKETQDLSALWNNLSLLPEEQPSEALRIRFHSMLDAYRQGMEQGRAKASVKDALNGWLERWWPRQPLTQFGFACALLLLGLFAGNLFQQGEVSQLRTEFKEVQQMMAISLLNQTSTSERLKGVTWTSRVPQPEPKLVNALVNTLNYDQSVNVRLAAVDALYEFNNRDGVREALTLSLTRQKSPIVQIALIDLLVELQERSSLDVLKDLTDAQNPSVKARAEKGIEILRREIAR